MRPTVQQTLMMITIIKEVIARDKTFLYFFLELKDQGLVFWKRRNFSGP